MPLPDPVSRMNIGSYLHPSHLKVLCNLLSICVSLCSMLLKSVMLAAKVHSSLVAEIHTTSLGLFALYRGFCFPQFAAVHPLLGSQAQPVTATVFSMLFGLRLGGMGVVMS